MISGNGLSWVKDSARDSKGQCKGKGPVVGKGRRRGLWCIIGEGESLHPKIAWQELGEG